MAKVITAEWKEALEMLSDCRIIREPVLQGQAQIDILLEDPAGRRFLLEINSVPLPAMVGNLLAVNGAFGMRVLAPVPGEKFRDIVF